MIEFGMIPEFVGRLPVLAPLDAADAWRRWFTILTEPKNAMVRQYQHLFGAGGGEADLYGRRAASHRGSAAAKRETGARALRAVMEEIMLRG
jgi:ATP-dependent Clp protease ATP-binding subunit ClpX